MNTAKNRLYVCGILFLILLTVSCEDLEKPMIKGDLYGFYAQDMTKKAPDDYYHLTAVFRGEGRKCRIFVETGLEVSDTAVDKMISEFDDKIYKKISDVFGYYEDLYKNPGNIKLVILILDIRDGYNGSTVRGYVAGYFSSVNMFDRTSSYPYKYSNENPVLYIDANPNIVESKESYSTVAHEFQHLINFANDSVYDRTITIDGSTYTITQDTWIDEGLSLAAEQIYMGHHAYDRIEWFNRDKLGTIAKGNNFFTWGNGSEDAIFDDYASTYLFFQWLRIHSGGTDIFKDIGQSSKYDYQAVTGAAAARIDSSFANWSPLLGKWLEANYVNAPSGLSGYKDEIRTRVWARGSGTYQLYPGEAVYSMGGTGSASGSFETRSLSRSGPARNTDSLVTEDYLFMAYPNFDTSRIVMFNTDTDIYNRTLANYGKVKTGIQKTGTITGGRGETNSLSISANLRASMQDGGGAYRIDAGGLTGRAGPVPSGAISEGGFPKRIAE